MMIQTVGEGLFTSNTSVETEQPSAIVFVTLKWFKQINFSWTTENGYVNKTVPWGHSRSLHQDEQTAAAAYFKNYVQTGTQS